MRIVLRSKVTGRYYRGRSDWIADPAQALFFHNSPGALLFARLNGIPDVTAEVLLGERIVAVDADTHDPPQESHGAA